mgnify:CR=1 FL=1
MSWEPLRTDEPTDVPARKKADLDAQMLSGCTGFVAAALSGYGLAIWPFFVFPDAHTVRHLLFCLAAGGIPSSLLGVGASRRFGLAGAAGFVGGGMAAAVFLFLRLEQAVMFRGVPDAPQPEYPDFLKVLVPAAWVLWTAGVGALFVRWSEVREPDRPAQSEEDEEVQTRQRDAVRRNPRKSN